MLFRLSILRLDRRSFVDDFIVYSAVTDSGFACPRVDIGTWLTRPHVPHSALVPQIADLGVVAFFGPLLQRENRNH